MNTFLLKHLDRGRLGAAKVTDLGLLPSAFGFWGRWAAADHVESRSRAELPGAVMLSLSAPPLARTSRRTLAAAGPRFATGLRRCWPALPPSLGPSTSTAP